MPKCPVQKTPELVRKIKELREQDPPLSWQNIAAIIGTTADTVKCWVDSKYRQRRRHLVREARAGRASYQRPKEVRGKLYEASPKRRERGIVHGVPKQYEERRPTYTTATMAEVSSRDLTAQFFGDPVASRSALHQPRSKSAEYKAPPLVPYASERKLAGVPSVIK